MNHVFRFSLILLALLTASFLVWQVFQPQMLADVAFMQTLGRPLAAAAGVGLLAADVLIPVPASLVMIALGKLFGLAGGTLLSVAGGLSATFLGYWIGLRTPAVLPVFFREKDLAGARRFFDRWGFWAIGISRPVPLLAETLSVAAGMAGVGRGRMLGFSLLGLLPPAVLYAAAGHYGLDTDLGIYSFLLVMGVAGLFWLAGLFWQKRA